MIANTRPAPAPIAPPRTCGGPTPATGAVTIRDVDWCNRGYRYLFDTVEVVGGEHEIHVYTCDLVPGHEGEHVTELWRVKEVAYGDLDGNGVEDAAVVFDEFGFGCRDEDDMRLTRVRAFSIADGAVYQLGEDTVASIDDRVLAEVPTLAITGGQVVRTYAWRIGGTCEQRWSLNLFALVPVSACP